MLKPRRLAASAGSAGAISATVAAPEDADEADDGEAADEAEDADAAAGLTGTGPGSHRPGRLLRVIWLAESSAVGKRTTEKWLCVLRFAASLKAASPPGLKRSASENSTSHTMAAGC